LCERHVAMIVKCATIGTVQQKVFQRPTTENYPRPEV
jgi:hypothetical protein